ncbi:hypothetical protein PBCV1_a496L [Paramecium bursaria Chlorella virus 1]|uniref:Uncharacterized protein n=1 Tax=Paramecium bursaria Chlorella virus 1 TaxID=10506 RepID=Q98546_PBCV1|nr:hypothetical protein PBCV1_a496L [Paramecium bursaria Chlorella virus 1]AAC96863.1 hypothetical protein [Paramecium bursaria Chlorella virus 1]
MVQVLACGEVLLTLLIYLYNYFFIKSSYNCAKKISGCFFDFTHFSMKFDFIPNKNLRESDADLHESYKIP